MEEKVKKILSRVLDINIAIIDDGTSAETISNWDSLAHLNIIMSLEEAFSVEFDAEHISDMISYTSIIAMLVQLKRI